MNLIMTALTTGALIGYLSINTSWAENPNFSYTYCVVKNEPGDHIILSYPMPNTSLL